jgi:predicted NBD/HSP70 family sugar kinase
MTSAFWMQVQNTRRILKTIHEEQGVYRKMLARKTGLAPQTVTNIITMLIEKQIVLETPLPVDGKGRNPLALALHYARFHLLSVRINNEAILILLNDMEGTVKAKREFSFQEGADALELLKNGLDAITGEWEKRCRIEAAVISVTGIVNDREGIVIEAYALGWHKLSLKEELAYLNIPVFVLNDVNILGYYETAVSPGDKNFMLVKVDEGIGSVLVINKMVVSGTHQVSGEFGHITVGKPDEHILCFCGRTNCITQFIGKSALKRRLGKSYGEIKQDAKNKNDKTIGVISEIGSLMAPKISDLVVLLDLDRVILLGDVIEDFQEIIYPRLREEIKKDISFWVPFSRLEIKKYDNLPEICIQYIIYYYFSAQNDNCFLWDPRSP